MSLYKTVAVYIHLAEVQTTNSIQTEIKIIVSVRNICLEPNPMRRERNGAMLRLKFSGENAQ
jgi:hypothetical protein